MVKEAARRGIDRDEFAVARDVEPVDGLDRVLRLAMGGAEGGEVVPSHQGLRRAVHRLGIDFLPDPPGASLVERQRRAPVYDAVDVATPGAGKARVPVVRDRLALRHRDGQGAHLGIERLHQPEGRDVLLDVAVAAHGERMDPAVGAARRMERDLFAGDRLDRFLHRLLHARPMALALEALERAAVEFEREREAGQCTRVPAAIGLPRRKSATSIAGLPARWMRVGRIAA